MISKAATTAAWISMLARAWGEIIRADFDRTLNYIQSYIFELPFGQGRQFLSHSVAGKILGGWQVSGIMSLRTGTPLTFTGSNTLTLGSNGTTTLNQVVPVQILGGINTGNPWFDTASFAQTGVFERPRLLRAATSGADRAFSP